MEEGSSTVEVTFVFLMILLCLAGFVAAGIRTHDATMAVVAAEAFLQDETAVDADLEQLADAVMLGDGSASYTRRSEGYAERVTVTIRFPETFVRDALAGPAVRETIQSRTLTLSRLPAPEIIRLIRAARKLSGKE